MKNLIIPNNSARKSQLKSLPKRTTNPNHPIFDDINNTVEVEATVVAVVVTATAGKEIPITKRIIDTVLARERNLHQGINALYAVNMGIGLLNARKAMGLE